MRKKIDTFCLKHPDFGIPNLIRYITIANAVMWLLNMVNPRILPYMMFNPYYILHGQVWRLISFMFIPPSTGVLALIAFYFYYFIGTTLERQWGTARFNIYFFSGIILTVIYGFLVYFIAHMAVSLTAEYIYLSMFFSFAALFPDMQVLLFFIIPVKVKWLGLLDVAYLVFEFLQATSATRFAIAATFVNIAILYLRSHRSVRRSYSGRTMEDIFHSAVGTGASKNRSAGPVRRQMRPAGAVVHRCAICGRTQADNPDLEFRYCSKCEGGQEYCQDHLFTHVHVKVGEKPHMQGPN